MATFASRNRKRKNIKMKIMSKIVGHISQVIGPVVDVHFNLSADEVEAGPITCKKFTMHLPSREMMDVHLWLRYSNTSVKTQYVPWLWIAPTGCSVVWK